MKQLFKAFFALAVGAITLTSCNKEGESFDPYQQLELEKAQIKEYVQKNYPNATQYEDSGLWFEIIEPGETNSYTYKVSEVSGQKIIDSKATVKYRGKLVSNGTVFDQTEEGKNVDLRIALDLNSGQGSVIQAWILSFLPKTIKINDKDEKIGILFQNGAQTGSKFRIISPSLYAYGNYVQGKIPANSPLDFYVEVIKMEDYKPQSTN